MVDINLIGDEQTGEEKRSEQERVEDFTQTSSMDTQELAFEERTETFDTTKTGGFPHRRSYSSLVSTLIIFGVIVLIAGAIYFFFLSGDDQETAGLPPIIESESVAQPDEQVLEPTQPEVSGGTTLPEDQEVVEQLQSPGTTAEPSEPDMTQPEPLPSRPSPGPSPKSTAALPVNSAETLQTVTTLLSAVPGNLNTTLLSYAGSRLRLELVGASAADARAFATTLSQSFGGNFSVLSESQVATNGQSLEKVLISGTLPRNGSGGPMNVTVYSVKELQDWFRNTARALGLELRQIRAQRGISADGGFKTPVLVRLFGSKDVLLQFLSEMASENMNIDLAKVLLVSPDMVSYTDDQLTLVINLFVYEG